MNNNVVVNNPFTPVFGKIPPVLAGRTSVVDSLVCALSSDASSPELCSIITGVRGSGKTTLLQYIKFAAEELGWIVPSVTSQAGMLDDILQRARSAAQHLANPSPGNGKKLTSLKGPHIGVTWENEPALPMNFRSQITEMLDQLEATNTGILFLVDEIDGELDEMITLSTVFQHLIGENKKVALLMAGLPYHVNSLLTGKTTSFLRRAAQFHLGNLQNFEVEEAFNLTVQEGGKSIAEDALDLAVAKIEGFPFMMQLVGFRSWAASGKSEIIEANHVKQGSKIAREELKSRIFGATVSELTKSDLEFLAAMNKGEHTERAEIAQRTGRSSSWISKHKKRLLSSGVIEETRLGNVKFALPGFAEYLTEEGITAA